MPGPAKKSAHLHAIAGTRVHKTLPAAKTVPENAGFAAAGAPKVPADATFEPKKPRWLKNRYATESWNRLSAYMLKLGTLNEGNVDALASLCGVNGEIAELRNKDGAVIPSLLAQQARMMLDLHLTGTHSGSGGDRTPPTNRFARNGRRPG